MADSATDSSSSSDETYEGDQAVTSNARSQSTKSKTTFVGAALYCNFEQKVVDLNGELLGLSNKARLLGSSADVIASCARLREGLSEVLPEFEKSAKLFYSRDMEIHLRKRKAPLLLIPDRKTNKSSTEERHAPNISEKKGLSFGIQRIAQGMKDLCGCFEHSTGVTDKLQGLSAAEDFQQWALSMDAFKDDMESTAAQKYLFHSMGEIGSQFEVFTKDFVPAFVRIGISTVKASRKQGISQLENQTVVAALFAGVATSMLQASPSAEQGAREAANITLWYTCLIFSISSAVNGLLGLSWLQTIYAAPNRYVPVWVLIWIKQLPLVFLVLAVICSFVALVLMAFMPHQSLATLLIITILAVASCVGLLVILIWFLFELLVIYQTDGKMLLGDVIRDTLKRIRTMFAWRSIWARVTRFLRIKQTQINDIERGKGDTPSSAEDQKRVSLEATKESSRRHWQVAIGGVIQGLRQVKHPGYSPWVGPPRQGGSSMGSPKFMDFTQLVTKFVHDQEVKKLQNMAINDLVDYQRPAATMMQVHTLRFSGDGNLLLCSRIGAPAELLRVNPSCATTETVASTSTGKKSILSRRILDSRLWGQIDWSHDGAKLLIRSSKRWEIWSFEDAKEAKINQEERPSRSASWSGDGKELYIFEEEQVLSTYTDGNPAMRAILELPLQHFQVDGFCITSDSRWMLCSAKQPQKDNTSTQRPRSSVLVCDLQRHVIAKQVLVFYEMSNIALASNNESVLVSYENRSPSECWHLSVSGAGATIILHKTYMPSNAKTATFAKLPSIFGGDHDQLVLRAEMGGNIHVWDRITAIPLHFINASEGVIGGVLSSFSWNRGHYMLAAGTVNGKVAIWTLRDPAADSDTPPSEVQTAASISNVPPSQEPPASS